MGYVFTFFYLSESSSRPSSRCKDMPLFLFDQNYYRFISVIIIIFIFLIIWCRQPPFSGERKTKKAGAAWHAPVPAPASLLFTGLNSIFYISEHFPKSRIRPLLFGRLLRAVVMINNFSLAVHQTDADGILRHGEHGKPGFTRTEAGTGHRFDGAGQRA